MQPFYILYLSLQRLKLSLSYTLENQDRQSIET